MDRREMLGIVGAGAAGMLAMGGTARAGEGSHGEHDEHIEHLGKCARACAEAGAHCLKELCKGGGHAEAHARALELAAGCQEFCKLTAGLMACHNPLAKYAFESCSWACRDCAEGCEKAGGGKEMEECVKMCKMCEEMCKELHKKHGGAEGEHHSTASR